MDFERKIEGDKLTYELKNERVFEEIGEALFDYRENEYDGITKAYIHTNTPYYGNLTAEISKEMNYWDLKDHFDILSADWNKKQSCEAARKEFVYADFQQMMKDLGNIKSCDLTSETTSLEDALKLCKKVMTIFLKAEDLNLSDEQQKQFCQELKDLGCCKYKNAAEKFCANFNSSASVDSILHKGQNIEYPLLAFSQLLDVDHETFVDNFKHLTKGGKAESLCGQWLQAQEKTKTSCGMEQ